MLMFGGLGMKKLVCLLLSAIMICSSISALNIISFGIKNNEIDINEFASKVKEMITEYDVSENSLSTQAFSADKADENIEFETMRLVVKSESEIDTLNAVSVISGYRNLWVLQFETIEDTKKAFEYYNSLECVEYVEPDNVVYMTATESESIQPNGHLSWGSEAIGSDVVLDYLKTASVDLAEVKVGVIDSGIDYNHEFLKDRMIDKGENFSLSGDDTAMSDDPDSHGTHVAGIIVDNTPDTVKIKGYKIFDSEGETTELAFVTAIEKAVYDGMDIINMSLGGFDSQAVKESLLNAYSSGTVLVAGAGNDNMYCEYFLPSSLEQVIVVGAVGENLYRSSYSNFGGTLDFMAPGDDIYSTTNYDGYGYMSGTSMATPFTSASVAILLSINPKLSSDEIENQFKSNANSLEYFAHIDVGSGLLNIADSLDINRIKNATINVESGIYNNSVNVELTVVPNAKTYYSLDGSAPSAENGILYSEPFALAESAQLSWITYSDNKEIFQSYEDSEIIRIVHTADETDFEISENGELLAYNGTLSAIIVPDTINGITVKSVGSNAFNAESGATFNGISLPDTVTEIGQNAFNGNKSIEFVIGKGLETIGAHAFNECEIFDTLDAPNVKVINEYAFAGCYYYSGFNSFDIEIIDDYAFKNVKCIFELKLDKLKALGLHAFQYTQLEKVTLTSLESFKEYNGKECSGAFNRCDYLEYIDLPNLIEWGSTLDPSRSFSLLHHLKTFNAPKVKSLGRFAFYNCERLETINVESVETINNKSFFGCYSLKSLYLPNVKEIYREVFNNCNLEFAYLGKLESCLSHFTKSCSIIVPASCSNLIELDSNTISVSQKVHLKIFGTKGSYAEEWANSEHNYITTEFIEVPAILNDLPSEVEDNCTLSADVIGFNLTYQWYGTNDKNEIGTQIDGATEKKFIPDNTYKYYYCVVTSTDVSYEPVEIRTGICENKSFVSENVPANYTELDNVIATIPANLTIYTEESVAELNAVLDNIDRNLSNTEQETVNKYVEDLGVAIGNLKLKKADYSELEKVIKNVPDDLSIYTDESVFALNQALNAVEYNLDITNQDKVNEYVIAIEKAVANLKYKPANYSELDNIISLIPNDLSIYTNESIAELNAVLNGIDRNLNITQQPQVDKYVEDLRNAISNLKLKSADYSVLEEVIKTVPADLSLYTEESVATLNQALNAVDYNLDISNQQKIQEYAEAINTAISNLKLKPADYTKLEAALATIPADLSIYTEESRTALQAVINSIDYSLNITEQDKVDEYTKQVNEAINNLDEECWLIRLIKIIIAFFNQLFLRISDFVKGIFSN